MTRILLDTNLVIQQPVTAALDDAVEFCTSVLCYAEAQEGEFSADPAVAAGSVLQLSAAREALGEGLPFGERELVAYRAICAAIIRSGRLVTRARRLDMIIAATALANGITLATRNADDFAAVKAIVPVIRL